MNLRHCASTSRALTILRPLRHPLHRHFLVLEPWPRQRDEEENFLDGAGIKPRKVRGKLQVPGRANYHISEMK